jgi:hypothetical protein
MLLERPIIFEAFDRNGITIDVPRFVPNKRSRKRAKDSESYDSIQSISFDTNRPLDTSCARSSGQEDNGCERAHEKDGIEPTYELIYQPQIREIYDVLRELISMWFTAVPINALTYHQKTTIILKSHVIAMNGKIYHGYSPSRSFTWSDYLRSVHHTSQTTWSVIRKPLIHEPY